MIPGEIPECLKKLTYVEECCIKLAQPVSHIYCRKGGKTGMVGHTISFERNVQSIADVLPRLPQDLPFIVLETDGKKPIEFSVRPQVLREALEYLKANNEAYQHIVISNDNIDHYEQSQGKVVGLRSMKRDWDPLAEEEDDEDPINEREKVLEEDLAGDVPKPSSMAPLQTNTKNIDDILNEAFRAQDKTS